MCPSSATARLSVEPGSQGFARVAAPRLAGWFSDICLKLDRRDHLLNRYGQPRRCPSWHEVRDDVCQTIIEGTGVTPRRRRVALVDQRTDETRRLVSAPSETGINGPGEDSGGRGRVPHRPCTTLAAARQRINQLVMAVQLPVHRASVRDQAARSIQPSSQAAPDRAVSAAVPRLSRAAQRTLLFLFQLRIGAQDTGHQNGPRSTRLSAHIARYVRTGDADLLLRYAGYV